MLMLVGCGESGGVTSSADGYNADEKSNGVIISTTVGVDEVAVTTPRNLYGISTEMGVPPALPGN